MSGLCEYKDALGRPGEGVHAWRIGAAHGARDGIAGTDLLLTAGAAYLLSRSTKRGATTAGFLVVFIVLLLAAVAIHRLFCVDTALNRALGLAAPTQKNAD